MRPRVLAVAVALVAASACNPLAVPELRAVDRDLDGLPNHLDNAPSDPNAPRLDMNVDGLVDHRDQLDGDFDSELGNPSDPGSGRRLGDPADEDDDNDGVPDARDDCPLTSDPGQADTDDDGAGDACDPLDGRDTDGDGVPDGPSPGDPLYEAARAARARWSEGRTHFVIRIDALGRIFQNEFTQILTDAATLSPAAWAEKCWENYAPGDIESDLAYQPCGDESTRTLTLPGGLGVPVTLVAIPKLLWTDPPVVTWINDRNDNALLEIGQHGTYHANNVSVSDWRDTPADLYSCETCGLTVAESYELLRIGRDALLGGYENDAWIEQSGASAGSPAIDWSSSANALLSYAPPFNASDPAARQAIAALGFRAFSSSVRQEGVGDGNERGRIFTPEGSHHQRFDQFGMFHASADTELQPPDTSGDTYDREAYEAYLRSETNAGGLTTWLIEEVAWSGRPCNNAERLGTCRLGSNREDNTIYRPRWDAWLQVLDYVRHYPGGVAMTMGEVALAQAFDNAPTVPNADQADADHDGIGDVIEA